MDPTIVITLVLAGLIAVVVVLFLRRASGALRATSQIERFQEEAAGLGARLDVVLETTAARVDALRRHEVDGGAVLEELDGIMASLDQELAAAAGLAAPAALSASQQAIVAEIRHAQRALDLVRHGCALSAGPRARSRTAESQIAIKRGYLNLLHAREALARHVGDLAAARDPMESSWRTSRV